MKIASSKPPTPGSESRKVSLPTTTPAAPAPLPLPYPTGGGDVFERAGGSSLQALLGGPVKRQEVAPGLSGAQKQLATGVGNLLAKGEAAAAAAEWTDGVTHDPGVNVLELLAYTMRDLVSDVEDDKRYYLSKLTEGNRAAAALSDGLSTLAEASSTLAGKEAPSDGPADPSSLVQGVLREGSLQTTEDLRLFAEKVKGFNEAKRGLRDKLDGLGDDAQLANVDLKDLLQKQQQMLQMMSNISKMLYDGAQSILRKLGG